MGQGDEKRRGETALIAATATSYSRNPLNVHAVDAVRATAALLSAPHAPSATSDTPSRKHRP